MAEPLKLRHRRRMKRKEIDPVLDALEAVWGMTGMDPERPWEAADAEHVPVFLLGGSILAFEAEGQVAPTLRGLLKWPAKHRYVTVDMGAVRFVTNGADIMAPGITDADPALQPGDPVWVRDETHGRPLAIGVATQTGAELKDGQKGKVVRNLHTIGDRYWTFGQDA